MIIVTLLYCLKENSKLTCLDLRHIKFDWKTKTDSYVFSSFKSEIMCSASVRFPILMSIYKVFSFKRQKVSIPFEYNLYSAWKSKTKYLFQKWRKNHTIFCPIYILYYNNLFNQFIIYLEMIDQSVFAFLVWNQFVAFVLYCPQTTDFFSSNFQIFRFFLYFFSCSSQNDFSCIAANFCNDSKKVQR